MPSSMVASAEIDTMSVRGVIASRTTMSPNSKIEWISLRSSRSMASSSAATSASWRISSSLTNGPSVRPRPGSTTLARPIRPRESTRNGGKFVKNARIGDTRSTARSVCWIAKVFGTSSKNTKKAAISTTMPSTKPRVPKCCSSRTPVRLADTSWHTRITSSSELSVRSGRSSSRANLVAPLRPSSSSARARTRLMRVKAVSAMASTPETRNSAPIATRSSQSAPVMSRRYLDPRSPSLFLLELPEAGQQPALPLSHRLGLLILGMVVVQQMQDTVDDEQRHLVIERSLRAGLTPRHLRAHHDVADHGRRVGGLRRRAGPAPALVGLPPTRGDVVVHRKREHVRRPAAPRDRSRCGPSSAALVALVGVDDVLHDLVADDVGRPELDERDAVDAFEDVTDDEEAGSPAPFGEVDLGDVTGNDDVRAEPESGQEHLHLLGGRVLRLVEDDERVVEGAAPHEGERRDLDDTPVHQPCDDLGVEHVVERVVERTEVRVDLGEDVPGQEAEPLARLDRRARQDDAVDLLCLERLHGQRHGEVALARPGRTDAERDRVLPDGIHVLLLARGLRPHALAAAQDLGGEHVRRALIGLEHLDAASHAFAIEAVALLEEDHHLLEQPPDPLGLRGVAGDGDLVAADVDLDREGSLDQAQQLVTLTDKAHNQMVAWNGNRALSRRRRRPVAALVALGVRSPVERSAQVARRPSSSSRRPRSSALRPSTAARTRRSSRRIVSSRPLKSWRWS